MTSLFQYVTCAWLFPLYFVFFDNHTSDLNKRRAFIVKPKAMCHVTRQSKHKCTRLGSAPNPNSQASSPISEG